MPFPRASKALSRFTVLDLTRVRSGPTCVRQLADWGANVIKIETPARLDKGEALGGPRQGPDFQNLHRNKRSMTLNLKSPEGRAAFKRMVEKADVVVENFRPDVKNRLGIDYDALRKVNQRIVYASISGFGQDGPYRDRPGFDQIAQGMGGLMSITGLPGQGPVRVGIPIADLSRRAVLRARHPGRAARARSLRRRASGSPRRCCRRRSSCSISRPRAGCRRRGRQAGRQQSSDLDPDRRVQDQRRPHQYRRRRPRDVGALLPGDRRARARSRARISRPAPRARRTATRSTRRSKRSRSPSRAPSGSRSSTRPACRAARSIRSTKSSPTRRSSISASRKTARRPDGTQETFVGQPFSLSRTPSRIAAVAARARPAYRRGAQGIRLCRQ